MSSELTMGEHVRDALLTSNARQVPTRARANGIHLAAVVLASGREYVPTQVDVFHQWQGDVILEHAGGATRPEQGS